MRPKGWMVNPDWRRYYELRGEAIIAERQQEEHNALMRKAVAAQEEDQRKRREHEAASRAHWEECHAEKVAAGEIPEKQRTN